MTKCLSQTSCRRFASVRWSSRPRRRRSTELSIARRIIAWRCAWTPKPRRQRSDEAIDRMQQLAPSGYRCTARGDVVRALASAHARGAPAFLGVLSGGAIGAATSWMLADELIELHARIPEASGDSCCSMPSARPPPATTSAAAVGVHHALCALTAAWLAAPGTPHAPVDSRPGRRRGLCGIRRAGRIVSLRCRRRNCASSRTRR